MARLLTRVQLAMAIHAHRRTRGLLEGEYGSIHKGRSLDFDDLREYVAGDDVKDIDWKATARNAYPLVKRFVAVRKHTLLLVIGTGRSMAAVADPDGTATKRDVAVLAAGVLGYLAVRHGDLVGLVAGDTDGAEYLPLGGSVRHLEQVLQTAHARMQETSPRSDVAATLRYVVRAVRRRTILVLVDDLPAIDDDTAAVLRRLAAQHEVLRVHVDDLDATTPALVGRDVYDVESGARVGGWLRRDTRLREEAEQAADEARRASRRTLERIGVATVDVARETEVVGAVLRLLERHRHARV